MPRCTGVTTELCRKVLMSNFEEGCQLQGIFKFNNGLTWEVNTFWMRCQFISLHYALHSNWKLALPLYQHACCCTVSERNWENPEGKTHGDGECEKLRTLELEVKLRTLQLWDRVIMCCTTRPPMKVTICLIYQLVVSSLCNWNSGKLRFRTLLTTWSPW